MGFDVTFHPVSVSDLQRFVFDLVEPGGPVTTRAKELTRVRGKQADVTVGVLNRLPDFVGEVKEDGDFGMTISLSAAAVAGYLHPYWYARGSALSFVAAEHPPLARLFTSFTALAKGPVSKLEDDSHALITENYSASGVILPAKLGALKQLLAQLAKPAKKKGKAPLFELFDEEGYDALNRAIAYAEAHGLGLMEATDLVVPMANEGFTDLDNLRAHFLHNETYAKAGPPPAKKTVKAKVKAKKPAPKAKVAKKQSAKKKR